MRRAYCKLLTGTTVKDFKDVLPEFEEVFMDEVNSQPRERNFFARCEPINPAPPVITIRIMIILAFKSFLE